MKLLDVIQETNRLDFAGIRAVDTDIFVDVDVEWMIYRRCTECYNSLTASLIPCRITDLKRLGKPI